MLVKVRALVADPGGRWLASAGDDGTVRVWDPASGELLLTWLANDDGWVAWRPDGGVRHEGRPGDVWWATGLCRFGTDDLPLLRRYQPQLAELAPLYD